MSKAKKIYIPRLATVCLIVLAVLGIGTAAYAADVGGIQRAVQIWINGDQTDAVLDMRGASYTVSYKDQNGAVQEIQGGGVALGESGERPLTDTEIVEHLNYPEVEYRGDGTVWVCWHNQIKQIDGLFNEDGVCFIQIETDKGSLYMTVKDTGVYASSPHSYVAPEELMEN